MTNRSGSVLVVEDDPDIREALQDVLDGEGFEVRAAQNGLEAHGLLRDGFRPDVVVLDLMMPVLNGWQFLEVIRADAALAELPVVVVTAQPAAVPSADAVLRKPYSIDALLAVLQRLNAATAAGASATAHGAGASAREHAASAG